MHHIAAMKLFATVCTLTICDKIHYIVQCAYIFTTFVVISWIRLIDITLRLLEGRDYKNQLITSKFRRILTWVLSF